MLLFWLIRVVIVGIAAGWIVTRLANISNTTIAQNLLIGVVGSFAASLLGLHGSNIFAQIILSVVGAFIALFLYRFIREKL